MSGAAQGRWRRLTSFVCAWVVLGLVGCAAPHALVLHAVGRQDPQRPDSFVTASAEEVRRGLSVERQGQRQVATVGMPLAEGDRLQTGPGIAAMVRFPDGHQATLLPGTELRLGSLLDVVGKVIVETFRKAQNKFRVSTRYVTAGVEGTRFAVQSDGNDQVVIGVSEGLIELRSNSQAWAPVRLAADQMVTVVRDQPPGAPQQLRAELDSVFDLMRRGVFRPAALVPPPGMGPGR